MRMLYKIIRRFNEGRYTIVCDDQENITDITAKYDIDENNMRRFYLNENYKIADAQKGVPLEDYILENPKFSFNNSLVHSIEKINITPGNYYPNIYRPIVAQEAYSVGFGSFRPYFASQKDVFDYLPHDEHSLVQSIQQLSTLNNRLISIFNNIYPIRRNFSAYGHEMRNLLILACTEVEAQFRGILMKNAYPSTKNWNIQDFHILYDVLKLEDYTIKLAYFPEAGLIKPFQGWQKAKSLPWYRSYNSVKHGREENFDKATLIAAIKSVCAIAILLFAQYGVHIKYWNELIGPFFKLETAPDWEFDDCYLPPFANENWNEIKYSFNFTP